MTRERRLSNSKDFIFDDDFMMDLDPDLKELFLEEKKASSNSKLKKKAAKFKVGQSIEANGVFGTIIFGPYKNASNDNVYEIETEDGSMSTVNENSIELYVPPVEEKEEDDLL